MQVLFGTDNLLPCHGEVFFYPLFFSQQECDNYLDHLLNEIMWKQEPIKTMGREIMQPRLTAWCGDKDKSYTYSGVTMHPQPWTKQLLEIKERTESAAKVTFTSALLNLYRDGKDSMGWHRDNEKELGVNPIIGSVSLGIARTFQMRDYHDKSKKISIELTHGSFLLMCGETNHYWEHRVPKNTNISGKRINITFRTIL